MSRIRINAAGWTLVLLLGAGLVHAENRTIDGTGNSLKDPSLGSARTVCRRVAPVAYGDGLQTMAGAERPNPRDISNAVFSQSTPVDNGEGVSALLWQWGQFLDHDLNLISNESGEEVPIPIPAGDQWFDNPRRPGSVTIPFRRSLHDGGQPRQQINTVTHWLDASVIYGSDEKRARWLRSYYAGKLKVSRHYTDGVGEDFLPYNAGLENQSLGPFQSPASLFAAGDTRANEQPGLIAMHTIFDREHNRLAEVLLAEHANWTDEQIYQRARKMVGALMQVITYHEFLPMLLGADGIAPYHGYDDSVDPRVINVFSAAAFRFGHSMVQPVLLRLTADGSPIAQGHLNLRDSYFQPQRVLESGVDPIVRGLSVAVMQEIDTRVINDIRNFLFGPPGSGGMDLVALNIQRGRDHGLPGYNSVRRAFGLSPVQSFEEVSSKAEVSSALTSVYRSTEEIDPWVGMLAEDHVAGALVGQTIYTILKFQFESLRDGDRFFYLNDPEFSASEIAELEATRLADVISRNSTATLQP